LFAVAPASALKRVNLNLPLEARERLRALAKAAGEPEAVYARGLLLEAIERVEKSEFRRKLEASRTPELRARERKILLSLERVRG
jgi:predicted DNA-binding protein